MTEMKGVYFTAMAAVMLTTSAVVTFAADSFEEIQPPSPAIGAVVPQTYFGPAPSEVQPYQTLKSGKVDVERGTITLPLYEGAMKSGETVWYIVTDTDDKGNADQLGLNYSPKLTFADAGRAVRMAHLDGKFNLIFEAGKVDFSPKRSLTPGDAPNFFPPKQFQFQPSGVGDKDYTPLVKIMNAGGHIYNAPVVAYNVSADTLNQFGQSPRVPLALSNPAWQGNRRSDVAGRDGEFSLCGATANLTSTAQ